MLNAIRIMPLFPLNSLEWCVLLKVTVMVVVDAPLHPLTPMNIPLLGTERCRVMVPTTWRPVRRGTTSRTLLVARLVCLTMSVVEVPTCAMVRWKALPLCTVRAVRCLRVPLVAAG